MTFVILILLSFTTISNQGFVNSSYTQNARFEPRINVTTYSGQVGLFEDVAGIRFDAHYNGAFGIAFDKSEQYAFISSNNGKRIRKLSLFTSQAGLDVTGSNIYMHILNRYILSLSCSNPLMALSDGYGCRQPECKPLRWGQALDR
jgi:hypothetical protein